MGKKKRLNKIKKKKAIQKIKKVDGILESTLPQVKTKALIKVDKKNKFSEELEKIIEEEEGNLNTQSRFLRPFLGFPTGSFIKKIKVNKKTVVSSLTYLAVIASVSSVAVILELISDYRIMPRTVMASVDLGFEQIQHAQEKIQQELDKFENTPIPFEYNGQQISLTPAELGVKYSAEKTLAALPYFDFQNNNLIDLIKANISVNELKPEYTGDFENIEKKVEGKLNLSSKRAINASLYFDENKKVVVKPEQSGQKINSQLFKQSIVANLESLSNAPIQIQLENEKPTILAKDLENNKDSILKNLKNTLSLEYQNKKFKFEPLNHIEGISFISEKNQGSTKISADYKAVACRKSDGRDNGAPKDDIRAPDFLND